MNKLQTLSLATAAALTECSRRTWWRRIEQDLIKRIDSDSSNQARILLSDVLTYISVPLDEEDLKLILNADAGDPDSQNDLGQIFSIAGKPKIAFYWWEKSAHQNYPDAMQCLGYLYVAGQGIPQNTNLGIMWIAKAADAGHSIAAFQMNALCCNYK